MVAFEVVAFEPEFSEQPSSSVPRDMLRRLHSSIGDIAGCLSEGCARGGPSLRQSRAGVLGQGRGAGPRAARILFKEILKQHCGEQCHAGKSGASEHSARPGGDLGLIGLGQLDMKMWSHDQFFLYDIGLGKVFAVESVVSAKKTRSGVRNSRLWGKK